MKTIGGANKVQVKHKKKRSVTQINVYSDLCEIDPNYQDSCFDLAYEQFLKDNS